MHYTIGVVKEVEREEGKATVKEEGEFTIPLPLSELSGTVTDDVHKFVIILISSNVKIMKS